MSVFVLIAVKDRKELTKDCLESLKSQSYKDIKVILVDDGSVDGTVDLVRTYFPEVIIIEGDGNLWWTGAMRLAVEEARKQSQNGDFILCLNNDTEFGGDYINRLVQESVKNRRMILGTVSKSSDHKVIYNSHRIVKGTYRPVVVQTEDKIIDTKTLSGRGTLVPIEVFERIGNFSKQFPHYAADYDFFCRAKRAGFKLGIASDITTFSTSTKQGLSQSISAKRSISLEEFKNLFFSRRSSSNLYATTLITLKHVPFPQKFYGIFTIYAVFFKFFFINLVRNNLFGKKHHE